MCFCILPALATTLKVRSRKLKQIIGSADSNSLESNSQNKIFIDADISVLITAWNNSAIPKLSTNTSLANSQIFVDKTNSFIVKFDIFREYNVAALSQLLLIAIFK